MYCFSIKYPHVQEVLPSLKDLKGLDLLELRVDLLEDQSPEGITKEVQLLRENTKLPILFNLKTKNDGGMFSNNEEDIFKILNLALKLDLEYLSMGIEYSKKNMKALIKNKGETKIISSFYNDKRTYAKHGLRDLARRCITSKGDIIHISMHAENVEDNLSIFELISFIKKKYKKDIIAYCTGEKGKLSQIIGKEMGSYITFLPENISVEEIEKLKQSIL